MKKKMMKLAVVCLMHLYFAASVFATDIYLSSDGDDSQDGSSPSKAVATLTKALSLIPDLEEGYVIKVSGFIDISKEVSGNTGVSLNRKINFTIEGDSKETCGLDGNDKTGLLNFQSGVGGVVLKNLTLKNGNTSSGGAIYLANPNGVVIDGCIIKNNKASGRGGAIVINNSSAEDKTVVVRNSLIASNESTNDAAGAIYVNNGTANNSINVSIINSTIYGNSAKTYGGALFVTGAATGSSFSLVNATIVENQTYGNGGHGAGICFRDAASMQGYIYNCILEDNIALNNGSSLNSDITSNYNFSNDNFSLRHSYVGIFLASASSSYVDLPEYNNRIKYNNTKEAGLAKPSIDYINSQNSIPLEFDSDALEKGNAQYLQDLGINTDQLGNIRQFKNGKCAAGAVEVPAELVITDPYPHEYQHFFIYGQSLSAGQESTYPISVENVEGNYMIGEQIWFNYGNKNFDQLNPLVSTPALGISLTCENPLTAAVNQIRKRQSQDFPEIENRFIATSSGTGARPIADLSKGSSAGLYERDFLPALKHAKRNTTRTGSTIACPAIFWLQGENDYSAQMPKDDYKAAMVKLKNDMQSDITDEYGQATKPVFYTYQTGGMWTNGNRALLIGMAQLEASNEHDDIICVGPTYQLSFGNNHLNNHLCSNGSRWFGEYMGKVYYKTHVLGEKFKPLQPKALYRDAQNPKKIIVKFHVPELPLVFDELTSPKVQNYGFSIYMNNGKQTITDVRIVDDCVEITCANNLTAAVDVLYGEKNTMDGHGNLRDSDAYPAASNYVDADAKDENSHFIYPRTDETESFRPKTPEPKDETGNIIYNKPYPLYNFGVAFTYTIPAGESSFIVPNIDKGTDDIRSNKTGGNIQMKQSATSLRIFVTEATRFQVELTDISGKEAKKFRETQLPAQSTVEYDCSSLSSGVYIVNVRTSDGISKIQKIVIK